MWKTCEIYKLNRRTPSKYNDFILNKKTGALSADEYQLYNELNYILGKMSVSISASERKNFFTLPDGRVAYINGGQIRFLEKVNDRYELSNKLVINSTGDANGNFTSFFSGLALLSDGTLFAQEMYYLGGAKNYFGALILSLKGASYSINRRIEITNEMVFARKIPVVVVQSGSGVLLEGYNILSMNIDIINQGIGV